MLLGQSIRVTERVPENNTTNPPAVVQKKENGDESDMMGTSELSSALGALGQVVAASSQGLAHLMSAASPRTESKSEYDHHQGVDGMGSRKNSNNTVPIHNSSKGRVLHLVCGNMFDHVKNIAIADIVMLETDIPADNLPDLNELLAGMKEGSRTLTYLDLRKIWTTTSSPTSSAIPFPFRQLEQNKQLSDRFPTSWSVQRGHHFFLWCKDSNSGSSSNVVPKISGNSTTNYIAGIDPSSLFYGFRPSVSTKSNGSSAVNTNISSSNPENTLTLKQLEDELWRRHTSTPTGIMMTGGIGIQQLQQQQHRNQPIGPATVGGRNVQGSYGPSYNPPTTSGNGQRVNQPVGNASGSGLAYTQTNTNNPSFSPQSNVSSVPPNGRQRSSNHTTNNTSTNPSYHSSNHGTRCFPIGFSFRSLLFGDRSNTTRDGHGNNVSMNRKKDSSGGRKGDREVNNGTTASQVSRGNAYDNSTTTGTNAFVDRDRVIPLNADGTRSRGNLDPQPYGLLSRAISINTNNNTTLHGHNDSATSPRATASSSSSRVRTSGHDDIGIAMIDQNIIEVHHRDQHQHSDNDDDRGHSEKEAWSTDTVPAPTSTRYRVSNTPRTQNNDNKSPSAGGGGGGGWTVPVGNNTSSSSSSSSSLVVVNDAMSRHQHDIQQQQQQQQPAILSQLSQGSDAWYNLGCTIERLAFPLVSSSASGSPRSNTGPVHVTQGHGHGHGFTSVSVKQVHVGDDDGDGDADHSSGDDEDDNVNPDFDVDGDVNPSSSVQLHHHTHSPGLFLDHSLSHSLTLGRGGGGSYVWTNGSSTGHANGVPSSSPTTLLRPQPPSQSRTVPTTSPSSSSYVTHAHHSRNGGGGRASSLENNGGMSLDVEDHEEGMVQVLPIPSSPSGRQNNNNNSNSNGSNYGGGVGSGSGGGLTPFLPGGNFYNGPGMASPHVAGGAENVPGMDRSNQPNNNSQNNSNSSQNNDNSSNRGNQIVTNSGRVSRNNNNNNNNNNSVPKGKRQQQPLEDPRGCLIQ